MNARPSARQWAILLGIAAALATIWILRITDAPVVLDAAENLTMSLNLERNGVISMDTAAPVMPSMYREPLPAFVGALAIRAVDRLLGPAASEEYFYGERAKLLKLQNIPWLLLLCVTLFILARELRLAFLPSVLVVLAINAMLLPQQQFGFGYCMLDSLYTEAAATALLCTGSLLLYLAVDRRALKLMALAGVCFGLLALVKASFLYITVGLVLALPTISLLWRRPLGYGALQAAVLATVAGLLVLPWMLRNYWSVGYFGIAQRGGEVLYDRAVEDQMTLDEYVGSIYVWAPYPFGGPLRHVLGYSKSDLKEGGRLQRLNVFAGSGFYERDWAAAHEGRPQDTVTYDRRSDAERVLLTRQLAAAGNSQPGMAADRDLQARAISMILQHPLQHAAQVPTNLWRGAFLTFPILAAALWYALRRHRYALVMLLLPAFGSLLFCALFGHVEPRYSMPTYPIIACVLAVGGTRLLGRRSPTGKRNTVAGSHECC